MDEIKIITNSSGDWGVCMVNGIIISQGHDVKWTPFLGDIIDTLLDATIERIEISDKDMEEGNYENRIYSGGCSLGTGSI